MKSVRPDGKSERRTERHRAASPAGQSEIQLSLMPCIVLWVRHDHRRRQQQGRGGEVQPSPCTWPRGSTSRGTGSRLPTATRNKSSSQWLKEAAPEVKAIRMNDRT